jgi:ferredoxin
MNGKIYSASTPIRNEERCVHCGACVGQCPTEALAVDPSTKTVGFDSRRCVACELCLPACGYGVLGPPTNRIGRAGGIG